MHRSTEAEQRQNELDESMAEFIANGGKVKQLNDSDSAFNKPTRKRKRKGFEIGTGRALTNNKVLEIRAKVDPLEEPADRVHAMKKLSKKYNVNYNTVVKIVNRMSYQEVK